jgi:hypothetical protein
MAIYYCILIWLMLGGLLEQISIDVDRYLLYGFTLVLFIVLAGLKYNVGTDIAQYNSLYEHSSAYSNIARTGVEPGYYVLMKLFRLFGLGFVFFWFMICLANLSAKFYIFKKYTPYLFPALLIYFVGLFFERDFDGIRQGIGIGICYLSIPFILKRRFWPFFILVLLATSIHVSSIIFVAAYWLPNMKFSNKFIIIVLVIQVLMVSLHLSVTQGLLGLFPDSFVKDRLETYLNSSTADEKYSGQVGLSIGILFRIMVLICFILFRKRIQIEEKLYAFLKYGFFVGIFFSLLFNDVDILSHRLPYGFREMQIFIIPYFLTISKNLFFRFSIIIALFLYSVLLLYRILHTEDLGEYYYYDNYILHLLNIF